MTLTLTLNQAADEIADTVIANAAKLRVDVSRIAGGGRVLDFGIAAAGGLAAGKELARLCMSGMGDVSIVPGNIDGIGWPHVFVETDHPHAACLFSQYAGWQISVDKFFAMGSGPIRAAAAKEDLFEVNFGAEEEGEGEPRPEPEAELEPEAEASEAAAPEA